MHYHFSSLHNKAQFLLEKNLLPLEHVYTGYSRSYFGSALPLFHSEKPNLCTISVFLSAMGLIVKGSIFEVTVGSL